MIGMSFISFVILLIISVVVSGVLHYGLKYYATPGFESFCFKVVLAWVGARLGRSISAGQADHLD
jgi:SNF family Na+-dependent transporter